MKNTTYNKLKMSHYIGINELLKHQQRILELNDVMLDYNYATDNYLDNDTISDKERSYIKQSNATLQYLLSYINSLDNIIETVIANSEVNSLLKTDSEGE